MTSMRTDTPRRGRTPVRRSRAATTIPVDLRPERVSPVHPAIPKPTSGRLGSRQVVSVRGRRVSSSRQSGRQLRFITLVLLLLGAGVFLAMSLSAVSTEQTFQLQQLDATEAQLDNQIETLNRDLEDVSSSAELARRAQDMGLAVPTQPGILTRQDNGEITEERPADSATETIIDVNGEDQARSGATSDPKGTAELGAGGTLSAVPTTSSTGTATSTNTGATIPGVAPYTAGTATR